MTSGDIPSYAPLDSAPGENGIVTRHDVVKEAREWLHTPYRHQHRAKGYGVDCVGLVIGVARNLGLVPPTFDVNGYAATPDGKTMLATCDRFMDRIALHLLRPGNVLVYEFDARLGPQHMGIVGDHMEGGLTVIQALSTTPGGGRVIEWNIARPRKNWRASAAYALRGVR